MTARLARRLDRLEAAFASALRSDPDDVSAVDRKIRAAGEHLVILRHDAHDAAERMFILREALHGLLHLHAMEEAGQAHIDQRDRWAKAWAQAAEVYGDDGPRE